MNSVRPNNLSLKYQRFTSSDCKDIGIRQFEFVTKTQFLCDISLSNFAKLWFICSDKDCEISLAFFYFLQTVFGFSIFRTKWSNLMNLSQVAELPPF